MASCHLASQSSDWVINVYFTTVEEDVSAMRMGRLIIARDRFITSVNKFFICHLKQIGRIKT